MAFHVITRTFIEDQSIKADVLEMSEASARIFKQQEGLIQMTSLHSENETHLCTYLIWEDQKCHLTCMESKDFSTVTSQWTEFIKQGKIRFELDTYDKIDEFLAGRNS